jgi:hypothetical protein
MLRPILLCTAALALVAAAPASAEAANSCRAASTAAGTKIVTASQGAVVFSSKRLNQDVACSYKHKRQVKLDNIACCSLLRYRLGGRYLAYAYRLDEAFNEVDEMGVVDLKTGKRLKFGGGVRVNTYGFVNDFYVTSKGVLAWAQVEEDDSGDVTKRSVHVGAPGGKITELDSGNIAPRSLAVTSDGRTLYWVKDGAVQRHTL